MKKVVLFVSFVVSIYAETGNQATIADLKEAVYKLIIMNEKKSGNAKVVYKPLYTNRSYLDKYIKEYVRANGKYLPKR